MLINLLKDWNGVSAGLLLRGVQDVDDKTAQYLIDAGIAEVVEEAAPEDEPEAPTRNTRKKE